MLTAADILRVVLPVVLPQPLIAPADPQPQSQPQPQPRLQQQPAMQPARGEDDEGGGDDDNTEAARHADIAGAQQVKGKRKHSHRGAGNKARKRTMIREERYGTNDAQRTGTQQDD
jgi:hypothetical protein